MAVFNPNVITQQHSTANDIVNTGLFASKQVTDMIRENNKINAANWKNAWDKAVAESGGEKNLLETPQGRWLYGQYQAAMGYAANMNYSDQEIQDMMDAQRATPALMDAQVKAAMARQSAYGQAPGAVPAQGAAPGTMPGIAQADATRGGVGGGAQPQYDTRMVEIQRPMNPGEMQALRNQTAVGQSFLSQLAPVWSQQGIDSPVVNDPELGRQRPIPQTIGQVAGMEGGGYTGPVSQSGTVTETSYTGGTPQSGKEFSVNPGVWYASRPIDGVAPNPQQRAKLTAAANVPAEGYNGTYVHTSPKSTVSTVNSAKAIDQEMARTNGAAWSTAGMKNQPKTEAEAKNLWREKQRLYNPYRGKMGQEMMAYAWDMEVASRSDAELQAVQDKATGTWTVSAKKQTPGKPGKKNETTYEAMGPAGERPVDGMMTEYTEERTRRPEPVPPTPPAPTPTPTPEPDRTRKPYVERFDRFGRISARSEMLNRDPAYRQQMNSDAQVIANFRNMSPEELAAAGMPEAAEMKQRMVEWQDEKGFKADEARRQNLAFEYTYQRAPEPGSIAYTELKIQEAELQRKLLEAKSTPERLRLEEQAMRLDYEIKVAELKYRNSQLAAAKAGGMNIDDYMKLQKLGADNSNDAWKKMMEYGEKDAGFWKWFQKGDEGFKTIFADPGYSWQQGLIQQWLGGYGKWFNSQTGRTEPLPSSGGGQPQASSDSNSEEDAFLSKFLEGE